MLGQIGYKKMKGGIDGTRSGFLNAWFVLKVCSFLLGNLLRDIIG
jgi:hypothetical protein